MAKMVTISSSSTIRVTAGLQYKDVTNPDAHVPDRLKVNPDWPRHMVIIEQGVHDYPEEITQWATVKALEEQKIITISPAKEKESVSEKEQTDIKTVSAAKEEFRLEDAVPRRRKRTMSLEDLAANSEE